MRSLRVVLVGLVALPALWCGVKAGLAPEGRAPIVILSDAGFTAGNGVRSGAGTIDDPYVISGWRIDAKQGDHCVRVEGASSAFRIEDCVLVGASGYAVKLIDIERAEIVGCCISGSVFGVLLQSCTRCLLRDCAFDEIGWEAVTLVGSSGCDVAGCLFVEGGPAVELRERSTGNRFIRNAFLSECRTAIRLEALCGGNLIVLNDFHGPVCASESYNRWNDADGNGNYWSRYVGGDQDGDGVGDTPFTVLGGARESDRRPTMAPHHPEAETEWTLCDPDE
jgi:hypothetical protein